MNRNRPSEHRLSDNRSFRRPWYMMMFPRILSAVAQRRLQAHLKKGGLVAYPTESCYGLAVSLLCLKHSTNWFIWKNDHNTKAWLLLAIAWNSCNLCYKGRLKISKPCCMKHGRLRKLFYCRPAKKYCPHCGEKDAVNWLSGFRRMQVQDVCVRFWKCL